MNECSCGIPSTKNVEKAVKKAYGRLWASQKESKSKSHNSAFSPHDSLIKELAPHNGMKILDIGSGNGDTILAIAERVKPNGKAVGVDFSPKGIAFAKEKAKERNLENVAEFHLANAVKLPFPDSTFDAVISECVVCLIPDKQIALSEKVRVLKPGGRVLMHDVITWISMPKVITENETLYCDCIGGAVSVEDYVRMMEKAGLIKIKTVDFTKKAQKTLKRYILEQAINIEDEQKFQEAISFVRKGGIGYALFSGEKPKSNLEKLA